MRGKSTQTAAKRKAVQPLLWLSWLYTPIKDFGEDEILSRNMPEHFPLPKK